MNFDSQTTQVWPLPQTNNPDHTSVEVKQSKGKRRRRFCFWSIGITAVLLLILLVVFLSVLLTVLKPKDVKLKVEEVILQDFNAKISIQASVKAEFSLVTNSSLENPNYSSFKYENTSAYLYYYGDLVGQTAIPAGEIKSRTTTYMTNELHIFLSGNLLSGNLSRDFGRKEIPFTTGLTVKGTVNLLNIIKRKHSVSTSTCDLVVSLGNATMPSPSVTEFKCRSTMDM